MIERPSHNAFPRVGVASGSDSGISADIVATEAQRPGESSKVCRLCLAALVSLSCFATSVAAGSEPPPSTVCVGYDPEKHFWGLHGDPGTRQEDNCPAGYGFIASSHASGSLRDEVATLLLTGSCCPLPPNALTDSHVYALATCPDDSIITGVKVGTPTPASSSFWRSAVPPQRTYLLRCTRINTERYRLAPPRAGWLLALDVEFFSDLLFGLISEPSGITTRARIPAGIRFGVLRKDRFSWERSGCVGYPFGSLMTARNGRRCDTLSFRQLLTIDGEPAPTVPTCKKLNSPYDPAAVCAR